VRWKELVAVLLVKLALELAVLDSGETACYYVRGGIEPHSVEEEAAETEIGE